jgi:hypothetical protein
MPEGAVSMVRTEVKQGLILLAFSFMMNEVLTLPTMGFVLAGFIAVLFKFRPAPLIRNLFAIAVFVSYWISYGRVIDPEIGLNFLTTVIVLKLLEMDSERDDYMVFFGLLLVISAGSLFEKTLTYMLFFAGSFLILIRDFYLNLKLSFRLRDLGLSLFWVLPLTMALYLFVPRLMNPIPFNYSKLRSGEVGYTPEVNISEVTSLASNDRAAFQAMVSAEVPQSGLYWRANTLTQTDGWNWTAGAKDRVGAIRIEEEDIEKDLISQSIRLYGKEDYFFALDRPMYISYRNQNLALKETFSLFQQRSRWVPRYSVWSQKSPSQMKQEAEKAHLHVVLSKTQKDWIRNTFKGESLKEISQEFNVFLQQARFSYSLSPGKITSFEEFMMQKKVGFCSHYASALALVLRVKNIPARLVSGFMGGSYNPYANFYLVSQNDAHVWVEVLDNGVWTRVDPTEWIAPDRVRLGGEAFIKSINEDNFSYLSLSGFNLKWLQEARQWFGQWDFRFYQWLEQTDYYAQEAILEKLRFKRQWLYFLTPILMLTFMGLYTWYLTRNRSLKTESEQQRKWKAFLKQMKKKGIMIPLTSVREAEEYIQGIDHPEKESIISSWKNLIKESFEGPGDISQ